MDFFSFEGGRTAYRADFWVYGATVPLLAAMLVGFGPRTHGPLLAACVIVGLGLWSLVEYGLHRFVLHALQPFRRWHDEHHRRPAAQIGTPTLVSVALFATLVFAPAWALAGPWPACAFTLGMLGGYLAYVTTHFAVHHAAPPGLAGTVWLRRRRRCHARHHERRALRGCYGVTSGVWDRVFGSVSPSRTAARP